MPNTILIKRSGTAAAAPGSLSYGELALNYADGLLYYKNSSGSIVALGGITGVSATNQKLDALTFNGVTTTFNLKVNNVAATPNNAASLLISINGVIQEPLTAYTVSGSTITFTTAPASTDTFFGVYLVGGTGSGGAEEVLEYATTSVFPSPGDTSILYVATDTSRTYRWTGSQYVEIGPTSTYVASHTHDASALTTGTIDTSRLPTNTQTAMNLYLWSAFR